MTAYQQVSESSQNFVNTKRLRVKGMFSESECHVLNVSLLTKPGDAEMLCCGGVRNYDKMEMEGDPMIYIVIMLFVFSAGIASLMIIYMKKVKEMKQDFCSCLSQTLGTKGPRGC